MKEFCFIICTNDDLLLNECLNYINRLYIPEGYTTDVITIKDAPSMTSGYNAGMKASDADYKIYLHQDLFIADRFFLYNVLNIFSQDPSISLIGMAGVDQLPQSAIMWTIPILGHHNNLHLSLPYINKKPDNIKVYDCVAVDGAIMVTSKDIEWREDLFDGFDFYDVSECMEHRRRGYRIVVPYQEHSWCIHNDGVILNFYNYNKYRIIFLDEYKKEEFLLNDGDLIVPPTVSADKANAVYSNFGKNKELLQKEEQRILEMLNSALQACNSQLFIDICSDLYHKVDQNLVYKTAKTAVVLNIATALLKEKSLNLPLFSNSIFSINDLLTKYSQMVIALIRIEISPNDEFGLAAYQYIDQNNISSIMINTHLESMLSIHPDPIAILNNISNYYLSTGNIKQAAMYLAIIESQKANNS